MAYNYRASLNQEFDVARQKAKQQEQANAQGQRDALARRQAQLGGGPGGAFIKAEQQVQDQSAERLGQRTAEIDAAQRGELRRIAEVDEAREFQKGERVAGQEFSRGEREATQKYATGEREAAQKYATGERMSSQDWQALQAAEQRKWGTSEREAGQAFSRDERMSSQDWQANEAEEARNWQARENEIARTLQDNQWIREMALRWEQFSHEKDVDAFNMDMANKIFNKKDFLEQALGEAGLGWNKIKVGAADARWGGGSGMSTGGSPFGGGLGGIGGALASGGGSFF